MDFARGRGRRVTTVPLTVGAAAIILAGGAWGATSLLHPAAVIPSLDRNSVVTDVARRGPLVRSVAAPGTFTATRIAVVAAPSDGFVDAVAVRPGTHVGADTIVARLRNPDLDAVLAELDAQAEAARAELRSISDQAEAATLAQRATVRAAHSDHQQALAQVAADTALHAQGLIPDLQYHIALIKADEARDREQLGASGITATISDGRAKLAAQRAKLAGLTAQRVAKEAQRAALAVVAGAAGVVQNVQVDRGARVTAGTELARIAADGDLEAVLAVAENDARLIVPGLPVALSTAAGDARGVVARVDPAVQNGAVPVHVRLEAASHGMRPAMHVDGAVELEHISDATSIARPAGAADGGIVELYVLQPDGATARRTTVKLGRGSLERIQVRTGVTAGQTVIVSDTAAVQDAPRIKLN